MKPDATPRYRKPTMKTIRVFQPLRSLTVALLCVVLVVLGVVVVPPAPAEADVRNPILGGAQLTPTEVAAWYRAVKSQRDGATTKAGKTPIPYSATVSVELLAEYFINEGFRYGIRGDIAFAQSILESQYFEFPSNGQVRPTDNNFAGIGACNSCSGGRQFPDALTGVRAQIQHLRNYADPASRAAKLPDAPILPGYDTFFLKGKAPNWEDLNGKWAVPGTTYGQGIVGIFAKMLTYSGVSLTCPPDAPLGSLQTAGAGYLMATAAGGIYAFGKATDYGSLADKPLNQPIVNLVMTTTGAGYWMLARDGGIFSFGDAVFYGSMGGVRLNSPIVNMTPTPSGRGYWLVARDGGIFSFGDAEFFGSTGAMLLNQPIVGMAATPSGKGYWLVAADGGMFSFGDAEFMGSTGAQKLNLPVVGMASTPAGDGYWLVALDGGIFSFGNAPFYGSVGGCKGRFVLGIETSPTGKGYWINSAEGRVGTFGDARHFGWQFNAPKAPIALAVVS